MRRSRVSLLVAVAGVAGCSKRDDSEGTKILSRDTTLAAHLDTHQLAPQLPLPDACGTIAIAAQPAGANKLKAKELTRQAREAEILGNIQEARSLLRAASELDETNKSVIYQLGRTSEALGDRAAALTAYCHYLALTPTTTESAEVRQRVTTLSQPAVRVAGGNVSHGLPTRRRIATTTAQRAVRQQPMPKARVFAKETADRSVRGTSDSPSPHGPMAGTPKTDGADGAVVGGEVVATSRQTPTIDVDRSSPAPRSERRAPSQAQSAGIGAVTGAIIGAATDRSVKGAAIGAAAGGILGAVVGRGIRPAGRGIRS